MSDRALLTLNCGSSSIKFCLFEDSPELAERARGSVTGIGGDTPVFHIPKGENRLLPADTTLESALDIVIDWAVAPNQPWDLQAAGHRIVHGGADYVKPVAITETVLNDLERIIPLAPLHMPHNLGAIKALKNHLPELPQIGCFDTAFHAILSPLNYEYAVSQNLRNLGVRKYGFHGLSYEYIADVLKREAPGLYNGRVVVAHLGSGASLCAIKNGRSVDTTMGMTALEGLPMSTRSGAIDPGVLLYLQQQHGMSVEEIERELSKEAGLKGLSNLSSDIRDLHGSEARRAAFAIEYFALKVAQNIAALSVPMGGLDGVVFTAGIGEHDDVLRRKVARYLVHLPSFDVRVIPTNEEKMIAQHMRALLQAN